VLRLEQFDDHVRLPKPYECYLGDKAETCGSDRVTSWHGESLEERWQGPDLGEDELERRGLREEMAL